MPTEMATVQRRAGLAPLRMEVDPVRPSITPASLLSVAAIDNHAELLSGRGIDWGSGTGLLAIAAATHPGVEFVVGLELDRDEVARARSNAERNGVGARTRFLHADLFEPYPTEHDTGLGDLLDGTDFLIANPPAHPDGDGLGWRRAILLTARDYLREDAVALLQVARQYGKRTAGLAEDIGGYGYRGVIESSEWLPFDQTRPDLRSALRAYAAEEGRTGHSFSFGHPSDGSEIEATAAVALWEETGASPLTQWQMHLFVRTAA